VYKLLEKEKAMFSLTRDSSKDLDAMAKSFKRQVIVSVLAGVAYGVISWDWSSALFVPIAVMTLIYAAQTMEMILGLLIFVLLGIDFGIGFIMAAALLGAIAYDDPATAAYVVGFLALGALSFGCRALYHHLDEKIAMFRQKRAA
jgi:hypothetical protein